MKSIASGTALCVLLCCGQSLSGTPAPAVEFRQAIEVWLDAAVRVQVRPGQTPVFVNCYGGLEERVPREQQHLALALKQVSTYLMSETFAEMRGDPAFYKTRVTQKTNWSAAVTELVRAALVEAGYVPGAGFPESGPVLFSSPDKPTCKSGPCNCTTCDPNFICDCKTAPAVWKNPCYGARDNCDTFEEKPWMKLPNRWATEYDEIW